MSIKITPFGDMEKYTISDGGLLEADVIPYGAAVQALRFAGKDVVLGYNHPDDYRRGTNYIGATVGRSANRIAEACFMLDGRRCELSFNEQGRGHLHGGAEGMNKKLWSAAPLGENAVKMSLRLADGEEGYPGNLEASVTFSIEEDTLRIFYEATTDRPTIYNPTNHCFFNLNGADAAPVLDQRVQINADYFTPVNEKKVPTGELRPVADTLFDFRALRPIGDGIHSDDPMVKPSMGWDLNFALRGEGMRCAAVAEGDEIRMECHTDLPGMQFYSGNYLNDAQGKSGPMGQYQGFCFETQFFPDAPNHPEFISSRLDPETPFARVTEYRFSKK